MTASPLSPAAVHEIVAWVLPRVADTVPVINGTPAGMIEFEALDAKELPMMLVATTVNVYDVPLVKPVTVQLVVPAVVQVNPPGDEVTV